jgi:hypothetical protein
MSFAATLALLSLVTGGKLIEPGRPPPDKGALLLITDVETPEVLIDGQPMGDGSQAITLSAGSHKVAVRAPSGTETRVTVDVVAGEMRAVKVSVGGDDLAEPEFPWRRPVVYSLLVGAGLALTMGLVENAVANKRYADFNAAPADGVNDLVCNRALALNGGPACNALLESGHRAANVSRIALMTAPILALTAALVWLQARPAKRHHRLTEVACAPTLGALGAGCGARF